MTAALKTLKLIIGLLAVIAVLIVLPALKFGIATDWKVLSLAIAYFIFFLGTVWRVIRFGQLADREDDRQVESTTGRLASVITIAGLLSFHWATLYTYSTEIPQLDESIVLSLSITAIVFVAAAIIVSQVAISTLGKFFDRLTIKDDHQLVQEGIYSIIRHPIYTSYILLFLGYCAMFHSPVGLSILLATSLIWFGNRIGIEETMLEEEFGEDYRTYRQHTKRLFPYVY